MRKFLILDHTLSLVNKARNWASHTKYCSLSFRAPFKKWDNYYPCFHHHYRILAKKKVAFIQSSPSAPQSQQPFLMVGRYFVRLSFDLVLLPRGHCAGILMMRSLNPEFGMPLDWTQWKTPWDVCALHEKCEFYNNLVCRRKHQDCYHTRARHTSSAMCVLDSTANCCLFLL